MYQEKFLLEVLCEYVPEQLLTITKTLILIGSWSTPFVAKSENTEFAKTSALEWSGEFITGDSFMRLKTGQTWSKAINIKPLIEYQFRNNTSATSPPTVWYDVPYSLTAEENICEWELEIELIYLKSKYNQYLKNLIMLEVDLQLRITGGRIQIYKSI